MFSAHTVPMEHTYMYLYQWNTHTNGTLIHWNTHTNGTHIPMGHTYQWDTHTLEHTYQWDTHTNGTHIPMGHTYQWDTHTLEHTYQWDTHTNGTHIPMEHTYQWDTHTNGTHIPMGTHTSQWAHTQGDTHNTVPMGRTHANETHTRTRVSFSNADIHLIINLVDASTSFKTAVNWTPICLPRFNETGFLHAHVSFLPDDSPACLLLVSTDKEKFFALQECQEKILEVTQRVVDGMLPYVCMLLDSAVLYILHIHVCTCMVCTNKS